MSRLHHFESFEYPVKGKLLKISEKLKTKLQMGGIITLYLLQLLLVDTDEFLYLISCAAQDRWRMIISF